MDKVKIFHNGVRGEDGLLTSKHGMAFYHYHIDRDKKEIKRFWEDEKKTDNVENRFVKIGVCPRCLNGGPVGYECCQARGGQVWYAALRDDDREIHPFWVLERASTRMMPNMSWLELEQGCGANAKKKNKDWDEHHYVEWTPELEALVEAYKAEEEEDMRVENAKKISKPRAATTRKRKKKH